MGKIVYKSLFKYLDFDSYNIQLSFQDRRQRLRNCRVSANVNILCFQTFHPHIESRKELLTGNYLGDRTNCDCDPEDE